MFRDEVGHFGENGSLSSSTGFSRTGEVRTFAAGGRKGRMQSFVASERVGWHRRNRRIFSKFRFQPYRASVAFCHSLTKRPVSKVFVDTGDTAGNGGHRIRVLCTVGVLPGFGWSHGRSGGILCAPAITARRAGLPDELDDVNCCRHCWKLPQVECQFGQAPPSFNGLCSLHH